MAAARLAENVTRTGHLIARLAFEPRAALARTPN
jgi:hypothetical protein